MNDARTYISRTFTVPITLRSTYKVTLDDTEIDYGRYEIDPEYKAQIWNLLEEIIRNDLKDDVIHVGYPTHYEDH